MMKTINKKIRKQVYDKYNGHCAYCGKEIKFEEMQVDHLIPAYHNWSEDMLKMWGIERGSNDIDNLMPSCRACNFRKGTLSVETFRKALKKQALRLVTKNFSVKQSLDYELLKYDPNAKIIFYFEVVKLAEEKMKELDKKIIEYRQKIKQRKIINKKYII